MFLVLKKKRKKRETGNSIAMILGYFTHTPGTPDRVLEKDYIKNACWPQHNYPASSGAEALYCSYVICSSRAFPQYCDYKKNQ